MSKNFQPIEDAVRELLRAWDSPREYLPEEARGLDSVIDNYTGQRSDRTHIEQNLFTAAMTFIRRWRKTKTYSDEFYLLKEEFDIYCRLASPHDPIGRDVLEKIPEPRNPVLVDWLTNLADLAGAAVKFSALTILNAFDINPLAVAAKCIEKISSEELLTPTEKNLLYACEEFIDLWRACKMFGEQNDLSKLPTTLKKLADALNNLNSRFDLPSPPPYSDPTPYLYILMRNDLASMNAGKAVAQGSHAANQMVFEARSFKGDNADELDDLLDQWEDSANGFGTCICLTVTEAQMRSTVAAAKKAGLHANICHDPTYPLRDGETLHLIPLDTCAYVFGRKSDAKPFVGEFSLMP